MDMNKTIEYVARGIVLSDNDRVNKDEYIKSKTLEIQAAYEKDKYDF